LDYLSETERVTCVELTFNVEYVYRPNVYAPSDLIRAIASNNRLALAQFSSSGLALQARTDHLLNLLHSKASSLQHLALQGLDNGLSENDITPWRDTEVAAFASAVGALSMLQTLSLGQFRNPELSALTLHELLSHTRLQKLSIMGYENGEDFAEMLADRSHGQAVVRTQSRAIVNAVSLMLRSRVPLEVLELKKVSFSQRDMASLVQGLESCVSLVDLTLDGCIAGDAEKELLRFLRAGRRTAEHGICRLRLRDTLEARDLFVSVLKAADGKPQPVAASVGASLQVLSLPNQFYDIQKLLDVLVHGEHRLSSLCLGGLRDNGWSQLTRCLLNLLHLHEFHLKLLRTSEARHAASTFVRAMR
jgi:hypothetical protein